MTTDNIIHRNFAEHLQTIELVREALAEPIKKISQLLAHSLANGGTLFWCGNGGSAADSQHLAVRHYRPKNQKFITYMCANC